MLVYVIELGLLVDSGDKGLWMFPSTAGPCAWSMQELVSGLLSYGWRLDGAIIM